MTSDGKYFLTGDLYKINSDGIVNLTQIKKEEIVEILKNLTEFISFTADDKKYLIYVFTDITCPYSQKFHANIKNYNKLGISVNYLAYPIKGKSSESFKKMENIWNSQNQKENLIKFFNSDDQSNYIIKNNNNIVSKHIEIGNKLGVNSTPSIFFEDGTLVPGYKEPTDLFDQLQINSKNKRQNDIKLKIIEGELSTNHVMGGKSDGNIDINITAGNYISDQVMGGISVGKQIIKFENEPILNLFKNVRNRYY